MGYYQMLILLSSLVTLFTTVQAQTQGNDSVFRQLFC